MLYKYLGLAAGERLLSSGRLVFSLGDTFNDPLDVPRSPREGLGMFERLAGALVKDSMWRQQTGILCLTRAPANPLMWAHYADGHKGMVVGIDAAACGLCDEASNLIPAQYGSVVYVSRWQSGAYVGGATSKSTTIEDGLFVGTTHSFPMPHFEKLQRLFLQKPLQWAYEEEVRVAKCLDGVSDDLRHTPSGELQRITSSDGSMRYLFSIPLSAIRDVYFGIRADSFGSGAEAIYYDLRDALPHVNWWQCQLEQETYSIAFERYQTIAEVLGEP